MLTIPTPSLTFEGAGPNLAILEKPIQVKCGPVALPDGTPFTLEHVGAAGLLAYRRQSASALDVWSDETKEWVAAASVDPATLKPLPFFFKEDDPAFPWQGLVMAAGQADKDGNDQFEKAGGLFPSYAFRAFFVEKEGGSGASGLSTTTPDLQFTSFLDILRAGIRVPDGETPENATEIHFFLRNTALQPIGSVALYNKGERAEIEIKKDAVPGTPGAILRMKEDGEMEILGPEIAPGQRAQVRLRTSGDLEIQSAPGRTVRINNAMAITANGALQATGDLELQTAPGAAVRINNALDITTNGPDVTLQCAGALTLNANTFAVNTPGQVFTVP